MEITTRRVGKCKVLDCSGPITVGPAADAFRKAIIEAIQDGTLKVVLNLSDVPYIDEVGFGGLIGSWNHVKKQGGNLLFLNLASKILKLFTITKLTTVFDIYDDEQKALEGCEQPEIQPEKEEK